MVLNGVPVKEFDIKGVTYRICRNGIVIGPSGKVLNQKKDKDGYLYFEARGKHYLTHRAVALCFVPNPNPAEYDEVDHIDDDRANPNADNLQWMSHGDNVRKAAARGSYSGERNSHAILDLYQAIFVKQACKLGYNRKEIAKKLGISLYAISDLVRGKTWKMLE